MILEIAEDDRLSRVQSALVIATLSVLGWSLIILIVLLVYGALHL